jgi:four helix bundle protein
VTGDGKAEKWDESGGRPMEDGKYETKIRSYKDLLVYKKAYALCMNVYDGTKGFPKSEWYGLVSQMRRAAVSIPSNIAEGYRRKNRKEYVQFLRIALGSLAELETQVFLSTDMNFINREVGERMLNDAESVGQLLYRLIVSLGK